MWLARAEHDLLAAVFLVEEDLVSLRCIAQRQAVLITIVGSISPFSMRWRSGRM